MSCAKTRAPVPKEQKLSAIYSARKCHMKTRGTPYLSLHLSRKVNQKHFCIPRVMKEVSKTIKDFDYSYNIPISYSYISSSQTKWVVENESRLSQI